MLKVMGNRVYPREVTSQLLAVPGVLEAEVVGVRREAGDTTLAAFVVLGADAPAAADLRRHMAARVPAYMVPAIVIAKDAIPRTASGKPDHPALIAEAGASLDASTSQST
jgi:acyl-coenzyme A synthetase/AMP-(fatty) acid ligase